MENYYGDILVMFGCLIFIIAIVLTLKLLFTGAHHDTSAPADDSVKYTTDMLQFIRTFTSQVSVIQFRTFSDTRKLDKVTREQVQNIAKDVAEIVKKSIIEDHIDTDKMLVSMDFVDTYIVDCAVINVKNLLDKAVEAAVKDSE
jgi:hypothetical protein